MFNIMQAIGRNNTVVYYVVNTTTTKRTAYHVAINVFRNCSINHEPRDLTDIQHIGTIPEYSREAILTHYPELLI